MVTILLVMAPFLFWPKHRLEAMTGVSAASATLFRLYGMAIAALIVGYSAGLWQSMNGVFPWTAALMGIVSNAGAAGILAFKPSASSRASATIFGTIGALLIWATVYPNAATQPLTSG